MKSFLGFILYYISIGIFFIAGICLLNVIIGLINGDVNYTINAFISSLIFFGLGFLCFRISEKLMER